MMVKIIVFQSCDWITKSSEEPKPLTFDKYVWDYRNRLTGVVFKDATEGVLKSIEYTYDVDNQRIGKKIDGVVTERYVIDRNQIALVFDGTGAQKARYLYGAEIDRVLAEETGANLHWFLADEQGSIKDVVDNTGTVIDHITYDSFGRIVSQTNPIDLRFAYTGREWDAETGQYYYRARYYDPTVGKFISEDPLGFAGNDSNLSRYVNNQANYFVDPFGLQIAVPIRPPINQPLFPPINSDTGSSRNLPTNAEVLEMIEEANRLNQSARLAQFGLSSLNSSLQILAESIETNWQLHPSNIYNRRTITNDIPLVLSPGLNGPSSGSLDRLRLGSPETYIGQPGSFSPNPPGYNSDPFLSPSFNTGNTDRPNLSPSYLEAASNDLPDLRGMRPSQAQNVLNEAGFTTTQEQPSEAGWEKFTHPDRSRIDINWQSGRVVRSAAPVYGSNGSVINRGQRVKYDGTEIPRNIPHDQHPPEYLDITQ
jgi:RHS repeat-associated protein